MKPFLFLITLLAFVCVGVSAQVADISPLIKAWEVSDTSQTQKYLESIQFYYSHPDTVRKELIQKMHVYLDKHVNTRLQVRLMLFEEILK